MGGAGGASGTNAFTTPYGLGVFVQYFAPFYQRRRQLDGVTDEQMGAYVVVMRDNASRNPLAALNQPITIGDYLASRYVAESFRVFDCDMPVDAVCGVVVVTTPERARDLGHPPVYASAVTTGTGPKPDMIFWHDYDEMAITWSANRLWTNAGLGPADMDFAMRYDGLSPLAVYGLEAYGFVGKGESGAVLGDGEHLAGGRLPLNPHGGNNSEGRSWAIGHLVEAVLQLHGRAGPRQLPDVYATVANGGAITLRGTIVLHTHGPRSSRSRSRRTIRSSGQTYIAPNHSPCGGTVGGNMAAEVPADEAGSTVDGVGYGTRDSYTRVGDRFASFEALRAAGHVLRQGNTVVTTTHEAADMVFRNPQQYSSKFAPIGRAARPLIPIQNDPPEHKRYRQAFDPMFSPRAINPLEPDIARIVNEHIDRFQHKGECVLDEELGVPLPTQVFLTLMGLPLADSDLLLELKDGVLRPGYREGIDLSDGEAVARIGVETARRIYDYFQAFIDDRRRSPQRDDVMEEVLEAEVEGRRLTEEEILDACFLLLIAGLDTITNSLSLFYNQLARRPDLRGQLVADPAIIPPRWRSSSGTRRPRRWCSGWRWAIRSSAVSR